MTVIATIARGRTISCVFCCPVGRAAHGLVSSAGSGFANLVKHVTDDTSAFGRSLNSQGVSTVFGRAA